MFSHVRKGILMALAVVAGALGTLVAATAAAADGPPDPPPPSCGSNWDD